METITSSFGKRIRSIRVSKGISQEKLAERCGLHPTYIGQIERGEKSPTLDTVDKLSAGLEISVGELFYNMENVDTDFAKKAYNLLLPLPPSQQEKLYNVLCEILNL